MDAIPVIVPVNHTVKEAVGVHALMDAVAGVLVVVKADVIIVVTELVPTTHL